MNNVRDTSIDAYYAAQSTGQLGAQRQTILRAFGNTTSRLTLQQISVITGIPINAVSSAVNYLKTMTPFVVEDGRKRCPITGRMVIAHRATV